jgi:hypothetical protein
LVPRPRRLRRRARGSPVARKASPGPKPFLGPGAADGARLDELAQAQPDLGAQEYRDRVGLGCHPATVWRALRRLGLTFGKK